MQDRVADAVRADQEVGHRVQVDVRAVSVLMVVRREPLAVAVNVLTQVAEAVVDREVRHREAATIIVAVEVVAINSAAVMITVAVEAAAISLVAAEVVVTTEARVAEVVAIAVAAATALEAEAVDINLREGIVNAESSNHAIIIIADSPQVVMYQAVTVHAMRAAEVVAGATTRTVAAEVAGTPKTAEAVEEVISHVAAEAVVMTEAKVEVVVTIAVKAAEVATIRIVAEVVVATTRIVTSTGVVEVRVVVDAIKVATSADQFVVRLSTRRGGARMVVDKAQTGRIRVHRMGRHQAGSPIIMDSVRSVRKRKSVETLRAADHAVRATRAAGISNILLQQI
jgi:hypothetical protein